MYGLAPSPLLRAQYDPHAYPVAALADLRDSDRIFTSDTWGGYLIYRRYPAKVFVDGRSDFYGPAFEAEYAAVMGVRYNWEAILATHGVNTVLLAVDAPLAGALKGSHNWQAVHDDGVAIVFRATDVPRAPKPPGDVALSSEIKFPESPPGKIPCVTDVETEISQWPVKFLQFAAVFLQNAENISLNWPQRPDGSWLSSCIYQSIEREQQISNTNNQGKDDNNKQISE
jgi:hypothetical protein